MGWKQKLIKLVSHPLKIFSVFLNKQSGIINGETNTKIMIDRQAERKICSARIVAAIKKKAMKKTDMAK